MKLPSLNDPSVGKFLQVSTHELVSDAGDASARTADDRGAIRMRGDIVARPGLRGASGELWAGAAIAILDNIGGFTAGLASLPDGWVVTTNLRYRSLRPLLAEQSCATASVLRRGRRAVVTNVVFEADGVTFGDGVLTSAVLSPESGLPSWNRPVSIERVPLDEAESAQHFLQWIGLQALPPPAQDRWEGRIILEQKHRNPWGIAHGGVGPAAVVGLLEAAHPEHRVVDAALHYLAPVRTEHMRVTAQLIASRSGGGLFEVNILDAGADNRRCITGTMVTQKG